MKYLIILLLITSCTFSNKESDKVVDERRRIEIKTNHGSVVVELYNETPLHRDNFLKMVEENFYDSLLFHRVIENFIIQTGDPESHDAKPGQELGSGGLNHYTIPGEIIDTIFHKRGTLSAAKFGNFALDSDPTHFVIVQAGPIPDSTLDKYERYMNRELAVYHTFNADSNRSILEAVKKAYGEEDYQLCRQLTDSITQLAQTIKDPQFYTIPRVHREYYKQFGGAPTNDTRYTVFGEVVEGMNVVDSIAEIETDENDRPLLDVRIISMKVVK